MIRKLAALTAALILTAAAPVAQSQRGVFALQGGTQKTDGYLRGRFDLWMTPPGSKQPIRRYTVDMTKLMHVIIVSDDFRTFLHVHPTFRPDGHFVLSQPLPRAALYHVYADADPSGVGQQVFRFDVDAAGGAPASKDLSERSTTASAGPYTVKLSTNTIDAQRETPITVHVLKDGRPANDLHPYLGALAHCVFLNAADLSYVHVHPMPIGMAMGSMSGMEMPSLPSDSISSPDMLLHVELHEAGTYKLWLQFRGGRTLYVAPFVITAR